MLVSLACRLSMLFNGYTFISVPRLHWINHSPTKCRDFGPYAKKNMGEGMDGFKGYTYKA